MQTRAGVVQQRVQTLGTAEAEVQRNRPVITHHQRGRTMNLLDPVGQLPGIGHGGGERYQLHRGWAVNDRLLPDRAPLRVVHVVALIEHHRFHISQGIVMLIRLGVEHVAEDLRGHHHDGGLAIHAEVTGHQTHVLRAELIAEIAQFLIGESLQRCGVEDLLAMGQGTMNGVFTDQGFAGSCGGTDHDRMSLVEGIHGLQLKIIQREGKDF